MRYNFQTDRKYSVIDDGNQNFQVGLKINYFDCECAGKLDENKWLCRIFCFN